MVEYFATALTSLNTAMGLGKTLIDVRDFAKGQDTLIEFNKAIINAQGQIMAAQQEQMALTQKVAELEQECMSLKNWEAEREKYTRTEIATGVFAYIEKDYVGKLENAHKLCCNCFDNQKKSTLQQFHIREGRFVGLSCHHNCPDLKFRYYSDVT